MSYVVLLGVWILYGVLVWYIAGGWCCVGWWLGFLVSDSCRCVLVLGWLWCRCYWVWFGICFWWCFWRCCDSGVWFFVVFGLFFCVWLCFVGSFLLFLFCWLCCIVWCCVFIFSVGCYWCGWCGIWCWCDVVCVCRCWYGCVLMCGFLDGLVVGRRCGCWVIGFWGYSWLRYDSFCWWILVFSGYYCGSGRLCCWDWLVVFLVGVVGVLWLVLFGFVWYFGGIVFVL